MCNKQKSLHGEDLSSCWDSVGIYQLKADFLWGLHIVFICEDSSLEHKEEKQGVKRTGWTASVTFVFWIEMHILCW